MLHHKVPSEDITEQIYKHNGRYHRLQNSGSWKKRTSSLWRGGCTERLTITKTTHGRHVTEDSFFFNSSSGSWSYTDTLIVRLWDCGYFQQFLRFHGPIPTPWLSDCGTVGIFNRSSGSWSYTDTLILRLWDCGYLQQLLRFHGPIPTLWLSDCGTVCTTQKCSSKSKLLFWILTSCCHQLLSIHHLHRRGWIHRHAPERCRHVCCMTNGARVFTPKSSTWTDRAKRLSIDNRYVGITLT